MWRKAGLLLSVFAAFAVGPAAIARSHHANDAVILAQCPPQGDARFSPVRALNILKLRMDAPTSSDINPRVTLAAMLKPGNDRDRWRDSEGATITGYVANVKVGGVESVNCHTHDPRYRDTHIELTLTPMNDEESRHVIVEVTPQWREKMAARGIDWTTKTLRKTLLGRWITVTGWLLFDAEHANAAENTAKPGAHIWRATAWEIHPITEIRLSTSVNP